MYPVSVDYKAQRNKSLRNPSYLKVSFGVIEPDAYDGNDITDNGALFFSDSENTYKSETVSKRYLTMEKNRFILDGSNFLPPEIGDSIAYYQAYVSSQMSGSNGLFTVNPVVTITFSQPFAFKGLTFRFDSVLNSYPSQFRIKASLGGTVIYNQLKYPTSYDYILDENVPTVGQTCDKIELEFVQTSPVYRHAYLEYIMFGIVKLFADTDIKSATWKRDVDPLSTKLPTSTFDFTIIDKDLAYNPQNPTGIWQFLEERQPVWFEYGYGLDDGSIEWIVGGNTMTNGEVEITNDSIIPLVTFKTTSILSNLETVYYKGLYRPSGISLYDLAVDILEFAELPVLVNGNQPYELDVSLQSIITKAPMKEMPVREALQLVANAGMCTLDISREGAISIKKLDMVTVEDFGFDFSNIYSSPSVSKIPYLTSVDTFYNTIYVDGSPISIHESDVVLSGETDLVLKYNQSGHEGQLGVSAGLTIIGTPQYYANSCFVRLSGSGHISIIAKPLRIVKTGVSHYVGDTGYNCPIENELLTTPTDASNYAEWVANVLIRRNEFTVSDRGYPEIDCGDLVLFDTQFETDRQGSIIKSEITYNGALKGSTTFLAKDV